MLEMLVLSVIRIIPGLSFCSEWMEELVFRSNAFCVPQFWIAGSSKKSEKSKKSMYESFKCIAISFSFALIITAIGMLIWLCIKQFRQDPSLV